MGPCPDREEWASLLAEELSLKRRDELATHLAGCPACQKAIEQLAGDLAIPHAVVSPAEASGSARKNSEATLLQSVILRLLQEDHDEQPSANLSGDLPTGLLTPSDVPHALGRIGKYEVLSVIGRGGLGVVLKGLDPQLNRIVAIKTPAFEVASNSLARKRFLREAQAAAAVSHDHVVMIHAVDEVNGIPYLVMEYISGTSLDREIQEHGPFDVKKILRISLQTASGLAAAHRQGLVHRDVKPANILLENGVQRVKLTDFGLARAIDDASLTQSGVVAGTPEYMSPEQARGDAVDSRSDLFSLGSVMYAMCTGRSAFRADSTMGILRRVCDDEPRPIKQVNPEIPAWLTEIIMRLLAKDPADRLQTAQEVSDLLSSHLAHLQEPQSAPKPQRLHPIRKPGRFWKSLDAVATLAVIIILTAGILAFSWSRSESQTAAVVTPVPQLQGDASGQVELRTSHPTDGQTSIPPALNPSVIRTPVAAYSVQFSPNDSHLLIGTWGSGVQIIDRQTGLPGDGPSLSYSFVNRAIFLPDGRIAATSEPGTFQIVERHQGWAAQTFRLGTSQIWQLSASADGKLIAAAGDDGVAFVWNLDRGFQNRFEHGPVPETPPSESSESSPSSEKAPIIHVRSVAISPDGKLVAAGGNEDKTIRVWSVSENKQFRFWENIVASELIFLADSRRLLIAGSDLAAHIWDTETNKVTQSFRGHSGVVISVAVSPDQRMVATGSDDLTVRLWDVETGRQLARWTGHQGKITQVAFSHDGKWVASASPDMTVRLWSVLDGSNPDSLKNAP